MLLSSLGNSILESINNNEDKRYVINLYTQALIQACSLRIFLHIGQFV